MKDLFNNNNKNELVYFNGKEWMTKEVSNELSQKLIDSFNLLGSYSDLLIFYHALKESIRELNLFLNNLNFPNGDYVEYSRANKYLLNVLSIFYSTISYSEKNFNDFKEEIAPNIYDTYYSYRLFYNLRTYMTHKGLGVTSFETTIDEKGVITQAIIFASELIKYEKGNKKFRDELERLNVNKINIKEFVPEFSISINEMLFKIFNNHSEEINNAFTFIQNIYTNDCCGCIESFLKDKKFRKHGLLKSINNFLEIFSNELVYENKIDQDPTINVDIYNLFSTLSFKYFGMKRVYVVAKTNY